MHRGGRPSELDEHDAKHLVVRWLDQQAERQRLLRTLLRSVLILLGASVADTLLSLSDGDDLYLGWAAEPLLLVVWLLRVLLWIMIVVDLILLTRVLVRMRRLRRAHRAIARHPEI